MPNTPSPASLAARVLELDKAATPGPWVQGPTELMPWWAGSGDLVARDPERGDSPRILFSGNSHFDASADARLIAEYRTLAVQLAHAVLHPPAQDTTDGERRMRAAIAHAIEATLRAVDYQESEGIPREAQDIDYKGITQRAIDATKGREEG